MAIPTHVAIIATQHVLPDNTVIRKDTATLKQMQIASMELRVLEDGDIPNSSGNPTIKEYIEAEGDDDFQLMHLDQTFIVTQKLTP